MKFVQKNNNLHVWLRDFNGFSGENYGLLKRTVIGLFECFNVATVWACEINFSPLIPITIHPRVKPKECDIPSF